MMYLGLSIFVNVILIIYLIYIYLIKGELRENKKVENKKVEYAEVDSPDCAECLSELDRLNKEIVTLKFTHKDLNEKATIIRHGMDRLMQRAAQPNQPIINNFAYDNSP